MSGLEIERKFLVRKNCEAYKEMAESSCRIRQGYICSNTGRTVRVRTKECLDSSGKTVGMAAFLTIKGASHDGGLSRYEFEKEITADEAAQLLLLCGDGLIDKRRWIVAYGGKKWEIDEFFGDNEGLVMAEIELNSADEIFAKPDFIDCEVTGDRRFYNSQLLQRPFTLWCDTLPTANQ